MSMDRYHRAFGVYGILYRKNKLLVQAKKISHEIFILSSLEYTPMSLS